ncbi:putative quinol monooxygenase [Luteimonas suaedae]|uniref:putative quinol monooxygenase n=1 Tax=Luteimonas suaedae TaxID=2605430 RepID=UPI001CA82AD2|nr:antibiotic biosynthesis monooxygenase family protein [Luteimonas suaedae]
MTLLSIPAFRVRRFRKRGVARKIDGCVHRRHSTGGSLGRTENHHCRLDNRDPARRDATVARFRDLVQRARRAPGCLDLAITADPVDPGRINNFEFWRSEQDLAAWRAVASPPTDVAPMIRVEVQKHIVSSSGPPF